MMLYRRLDRYQYQARVAQRLTSTLRTSDTLNVKKILCIMTDINVLALTMRHEVSIDRVVHSPPRPQPPGQFHLNPKSALRLGVLVARIQNLGPSNGTCVSRELRKRSSRVERRIAVGPGWINWALESFMDEAAHTDPIGFRLRMLDGAGRNAGGPPSALGQAAVLACAAERAAWGTRMPNDVGLAVATTIGQERDMPTWVACVARVRVQRPSGRVIVERLTLAVDAGTIVHPDSAKAQVEGASLWGLSMALHEGSEFANGCPEIPISIPTRRCTSCAFNWRQASDAFRGAIDNASTGRSSPLTYSAALLLDGRQIALSLCARAGPAR